MADTSQQGAVNPSGSAWQYVGPAIQGASQVAGDLISSNTAAGGYNQAAGTIQTGLNASKGALNPYTMSGQEAENALLGMYGIGGKKPDFSKFTNSPGYQFTQQQGDQAIQRAANAQGNGFSTTTLAQLDKFNTGLASQTYQSYLDNLYKVVQTGATAGANQGNQAIQGATAIGQQQVGAAGARATGQSGVAGQLTNLAGMLPWQKIGSGVSGLINGSGGGPNTGDANGLNPDNNYGYNGPSPNYQTNDPTQSTTWDSSGNDIGTSTLYDPNPSTAGGEAAPVMQSVGMPDVNNMKAPNFNISGGSGANSSGVSLGSVAGAVTPALSVYNGLKAGGVSGYAGAALGANTVAQKLSGGSLGSSNPALGAAGSALGIYNGIKSGTPVGYVGAAANAAQLAGSQLGSSALGIGAGTAGALAAAGTGIGIAVAIPGLVNGVLDMLSSGDAKKQAALQAWMKSNGITPANDPAVDASKTGSGSFGLSRGSNGQIVAPVGYLRLPNGQIINEGQANPLFKSWLAQNGYPTSYAASDAQMNAWAKRTGLKTSLTSPSVQNPSNPAQGFVRPGTTPPTTPTKTQPPVSGGFGLTTPG